MPTGFLIFFFQSSDGKMWSPVFLHSKTHNILHIIFLLQKNCMSQILCVQALKYRATYKIEMDFFAIQIALLVWRLDMTSLFSITAISTKSSRATNKARGHVARKESSCFCHLPIIWLAVETAENMVALNVNYSVLIITVLGVY